MVNPLRSLARFLTCVALRSTVARVISWIPDPGLWLLVLAFSLFESFVPFVVNPSSLAATALLPLCSLGPLWLVIDHFFLPAPTQDKPHGKPEK